MQKAMFLTDLYKYGSQWMGVFRILDNQGFCFGSEFRKADTREELMQLHGCEC